MKRRNEKKRRKSTSGPLLMVTGRIRLVLVLLVAFLVVCGVRVGYLQLCMGAEKAERGRRQQFRSQTYYAKRGKIVDRRKNILSLTIPFKHIEVLAPVANKELAAHFIAGATGLSVDRVWKRARFDRHELPRWPGWEETEGFFGEEGYVAEFWDRRPRPIVFFQTVDPNMTRSLERILSYQIPTKLDENECVVKDLEAADKEMLWLKENLKGLRVTTYGRRVNPHRELAGATVGLAQLPRENFQKIRGREDVAMDQQGVSGIEAAVDPWIGGRLIKQRGLKRKGHRIVYLPGNPALDLEDYTAQTTLDVEIQQIVEEELERGVINARANRGIAVVMDTKTSELRAVAHYPPFNPSASQLYGSDELSKMTAGAFALAFEPGSTVKGLVVAAALNEGVITRDERVFCEEGEWYVEKKEKPITDTHPMGWVTMDEAMKHSSNIYHGKVALLNLGPERLYEYYRRFGFGQLTNVLWDESPEVSEHLVPWQDESKDTEKLKIANREASGRLAHWNKWTTIDTANAGFGHGFSIHPVQLAAAFTALANGGIWKSPVLIREVRDSDGNVVARPERIERRVVRADVARIVCELMERVVEPGGTGERAAVYGVPVAGKTGTAAKAIGIRARIRNDKGEISRVTKGTYMEGRYVASFAGIVPSRDPRFVIVVYIDEPSNKHAGGEVAGPVFSRMASRILAHTNILEGQESDSFVEVEPQGDIADVASGETNQQTDEGAAMPETLGVGATKIPDFQGMSVRKVMEVSQARGLRIEAHGSGRAVKQSMQAGTVVVPGTAIRVDFERGSL